MAQRTRWLIAFAVLLPFMTSCRTMQRLPDQRQAFAVDGGGRAITALESGSTLFVGGRDLRPNTLYEFRLGVGGGTPDSARTAVSFARSTTDRRGQIPPLILWYEGGVVGCAGRPELREGENALRFRTFDEAESALRGRSLTVSVHEVDRRTPAASPLERPTGAAVSSFSIPVTPRKSPMVYPSNEDGCLMNAIEATNEDLYVSGRNFKPGQQVDIAVVRNQRAWHENDVINDVSGAGSASAMERVTADSQGRFTVKAWDRANHRRGVYDLIAHDINAAPDHVSPHDIVSFGPESGLVLYLLYPVGGPTMDIAGRPFNRSPYFAFADSFADANDPVWGAVDPTYVPAGHPGGTWAAYFVVNHRNVNGWDPGMGGATNLVDVSGGEEIHPVKSGCVNGTDVIIWNPPLTQGQYDVVVEFGTTVAMDAGTFAGDHNYDSARDFLDGANQIGFVVAKDPFALGPLAVGQDAYSVDDFFPTLGSRQNVDLRAVIRYPATAAGVGTPAAPGMHPLFVIEHGNHSTCRVAGFDGNPAYDLVHTGCPDRVRNHEGYLGLLDRLASHGIIAVSIDAYDLTGFVPQLNAERSDLILKHLELWSHLNDASTFTAYPNFFASRFANHVDLSKISVSGHSRGGEASVGAYMRNLAAGGTFNIGSVSSIAPVDSIGHTLPDVPYFVILPAADGDVASLSGLRIYDRAGSTLPTVDGTTKSGIDVYGANHNFFNTVWAADGDDASAARPDFIPAADQQRLGEAFLAAFGREQLKNETVYADLFRGGLTFPSFAGRKVYAFRHEKTHAKIESGAATGVASGGGTSVSVVSPSIHQTSAVRLGWPSGTAVLTYSVPLAQQNASTFEVLSFRVAQTNAVTNPPAGNQDFQVELVGGGNLKATWTSSYDDIPPPYDRPGGGTNHNVMTTVRVPLHSFIMNNAGVTLNSVDTVRFRFLSPTQGEIYVDDVEFSR